LQNLKSLYYAQTLVGWRGPKHFLASSTGSALAGAGPNARPRRGAPLSSGFMTSSCSVNRVIRPR